MTHSLTDEICDELSPWHIANFDVYDADRIRRGMRAAYDLGESRGRAEMLEQVIEWIEKKRGGSIKLHNSEINNLIIDLKKAMRPQEDI